MLTILTIYQCCVVSESFFHYNIIGSVMVSVFASSAVDGVTPRIKKMVFVAFPLSTQQYGLTSQTGFLGIRLMCPNGATRLPVC